MSYNDVRTPEAHAAATGNATLDPQTDAIEYSVGHIAAAQLHGWEAHKRATTEAFTLIEGYYLEAITAALAGSVPYASALSPYAISGAVPPIGPGKHLVEYDAETPWVTFEDLPLPATSSQVFDYLVRAFGYLESDPTDRVLESTVVRVTRDGSGNASLLSSATPFTETRLRIVVGTDDITIDVQAHATEDWVWDTDAKVDTGRYGATGSSLSVHLPDGTSVAVSAIAGVDSVISGVANAVPPYIYGRDAAPMLAQFVSSTSNIALFIVGDSRSVEFAKYAAPVWSHVYVTGMSIVQNNGLGMPPFTSSMLVNAANTRVASIRFSGEYLNDYMLWGTQEAICTAAVSGAEASIAAHRIGGGYIATAGQPLVFPRITGQALKAHSLFRISPLGVQAENVWFQHRGNVLSGDSYQRTALFSTYHATDTSVVRKSVTVPSAADLVGQVNLEHGYGPSLTVPNELVATTRQPWFERADGIGVTIHEFANFGSQTIEDLVDEGYYRTANQYVDAVLGSEIPLRADRKEVWFWINLGTNNNAWNTQQQHEAQLVRLIERLRSTTKRPGARVILCTANVGSGNEATAYYQQAAIAVSRRVPGVMAIDSYAMTIDLGGYSVLNGMGYITDGTHLTPTGRAWFETQCDRLFAGETPTL